MEVEKESELKHKNKSIQEEIELKGRGGKRLLSNCLPIAEWVPTLMVMIVFG